MCSWLHVYSTVIFGVFPLHQIAHVGVRQHISLKLFRREIIFKEFQVATYVSTVLVPEVRHTQVDAVLSQYRAVHSIAREKEIIIS